MYIKYIMSYMSMIMLEVEESIPTIEASFVDSILSILDLVFSKFYGKVGVILSILDLVFSKFYGKVGVVWSCPFWIWYISISL